MKRIATSLPALCAALLTILAACADPPPEVEGDDIVDAPLSVPLDFAPDQVIAKLAVPIQRGVAVTAGGHRLIPLKPLPSGSWLFRIDDGRRAPDRDVAAETLAAIARIAADPIVEDAYENVAFELSLVPADPEAAPGSGRQAWSLAQANLYAAWDVTTGSPSVRVALIDSGRREHPELFARWGQGYDFIHGDFDPTDDPDDHPAHADWAHGIHVAGIVGARASNGVGGAGVCWSCPLLPLRVTPSFSTAPNPRGIAYIAELEEAVAWAAGPEGGQRRAEVINFSLNDRTRNDCNLSAFTNLRNEITRAISRGVVVVSSAGNQGTGASNALPRVPATCPGVLSVIASGPDGTVPTYSTRGAGTDLVAPGGGLDQDWHYGEGVACPTAIYGAGTLGVFSSWAYRQDGADAFCFRHLSGTSMAAPHVTGVVALMRSVNPSLTPAQIEQYLLATARPSAITCPAPGACGAGLIDAHAAVLAARDGLVDVEVTPSSLAFPPTRVTTSSTLALNVRNAGSGTLSSQVTAPTPLTLTCGTGTAACTCTTATTCNVVAGGGQQRALQVLYAPTAVGSFAGNLTVQSNDSDEAFLVVPASGTATVSEVRLSPDLMHFGNVPVGTASPAQVATLVNAGAAPLVVTAITATGHTDQYTITPAQALPFVVAPGGQASFGVRCVPTSVGRKTLMLNVVSDANLTDAPIDVRCDGVAPDARLIVDPPGPAFGPVQVGTTATRTVRVMNVSQGTTQLSFQLVRPPPPFGLTCTSGCTCSASVCSGTVTSGGASAVLALTFTPTSVAAWGSSIAFSSNAPNLPSTAIAISGSGAVGTLTVIEPVGGVLTLSEGALSGVVRVRNDGVVPVSLYGGRIDPAAAMASAFTVSPQDGGKSIVTTVGPGTTFEWKIGCQPTWRTGRFTVGFLVDSDLGTGTQLATVTCQTGPITN